MKEVKNTQIKIFEERQVRTIWDKEKEEWYFSVVDVIAVLTDSEIPRRYWSDLKRKLIAEGSQLYEEIVQFTPFAASKATFALNAESCILNLLIVNSPITKVNLFTL